MLSRFFSAGEEPRIKRATWEEVKPYLERAADRFEVFSVHGTRGNLKKVYCDDGAGSEGGGPTTA